MIPSIFGAGTGISYDQLQQRKALLNAMKARRRTPRNKGEGLAYLGQVLGDIGEGYGLRRAERANNEHAQKLLADIFGGGAPLASPTGGAGTPVVPPVGDAPAAPPAAVPVVPAADTTVPDVPAMPVESAVDIHDVPEADPNLKSKLAAVLGRQGVGPQAAVPGVPAPDLSTSGAPMAGPVMPDAPPAVTPDVPPAASPVSVDPLVEAVKNYAVRGNRAMNPLFTLSGGQSRMTNAAAGRNMENLLNTKYAALQRLFGGELTINDAIAKSGTSRERNTPGSQHFHGNALDISLVGMDDATRLRLLKAAKEAGFTGFGFGRNILHVDTGRARSWTYKTTGPNFAGMPISAARALVAGADGATAGHSVNALAAHLASPTLDPAAAPVSPAGGQLPGSGPAAPATPASPAPAPAGDPGDRLRRIIMAAADPRLPPSYRQIFGILLQQEMAKNKPMDPRLALAERRFALEQARFGEQRRMNDAKLAGKYRPNSVTVNNITGDKAYAKANAKNVADLTKVYFEDGMNARQIVSDVDEMEEILRGGGLMTGDGWRLWAQDKLGVNVASPDSERFNAIIARLVPAQRPPGSGVMSDRDIDLFKDSLPKMVNSKEGNLLILRTMRAVAEWKMRVGDIASRMITGELDFRAGVAEMNKLGDPMAEFKSKHKAYEAPASIESGTSTSGAVPSAFSEFAKEKGFDPDAIAKTWSSMTPADRDYWLKKDGANGR